MTHVRSIRFPGGTRPRRSPLFLGAVFAGVVLAGAGAGAQGTPARLLVSTTSDVPATTDHPLITDESLTAAAGGDVVRPQFVEGHWLGTAGFVPSDIDGFAYLPGAVPGQNASFAFSLLSNEGGFEDGDVLTFAPTGGLQVVWSEDQLVFALGLLDEDIDVDALDFNDAGELLFSLQADVAGTYLGTVADGDVLRLTNSGAVVRMFEEWEIQTMFTAATGLTGAIGDVQGIEFANGELWVATQGPSSHDGAVLSCGAVPTIVLDEAAVGLGGAEIDALSVLPAAGEIPTVRVDRILAQPGDTVHADLHGTPFSVQLVLTAGDFGIMDFSRFPGWGAVYMDPADPWLTTVIGAPFANMVVVDAAGDFATDYALPLPDVWGVGFGGEEGWTFQSVNLGTLEFSAPFRVEKQ